MSKQRTEKGRAKGINWGVSRLGKINLQRRQIRMLLTGTLRQRIEELKEW